MSPKQLVVIVDGGILSEISCVLTRYSANDRQFPVNDGSLFTGKFHSGGASRTNGSAGEEVTRRVAARRCWRARRRVPPR